MRLIPVGLLSLLLACAPKEAPVESWQHGAREAGMERQKELAATPSKEQALDNLRLASMALAEGDQDLAEQALRRAAGPMTTFQADGEFAAVVGAEQAKEWKGEPYEKSAAFFTLGVLLHAGGDRGNALAMYRSSVLADTGSAEQRYRSDFVPGWVMQALAFASEGEAGNAQQALDRGIDAWWSRHTIEVLTKALQSETVRAAGGADGDLARAVLAESLSAGTSAAPRDAHEAARATASWAGDLLRVQRDRAKKERSGVFSAFRGNDFDRAAEALGPVSAAWQEAVQERPTDPGGRGARFAAQLQLLLDEPPNTVLIVERGRGPVKTREGEYGHVMTIRPGPGQVTRPEVRVGDEAVPAVELDDLLFQASTRGGRGVDGFLKGKAVYKDTSMISGYVLLRAAEVAAWSDKGDLAGVLAVAGGVLFISGAVTNPAADVRRWELAPGGWYLVSADLEPGSHTLRIDGSEHRLDVPAHGQLVALVPALSPHGSGVIAPRAQD